MIREPKGIIETENADEHWGFFNATDKVVLDLGCGINNNEFAPTPLWFIMTKKASKVYGVDSNPQSYQWFKQNYNVYNFVSFMDYIDSIDKFNWYIGNVKPDIIKIDVEGAEVMLNALDIKLLELVQQIGIEYHNLPCLIACEMKLEEAGFELEYYKFKHLPIDHQGVLHGIKK